ncbi:hypothetical protein PVAP13_5KG565600 [Panicum virgatum]|uniref:Uncharacterized protein n=1 Tax=Panicum virgatum TaxID=38727 RepID=A0A8T0SUY8_PANVG|nr:hypothetical protein PVAP13_5KG565600 [Panicum virgatum]
MTRSTGKTRKKRWIPTPFGLRRDTEGEGRGTKRCWRRETPAAALGLRAKLGVENFCTEESVATWFLDPRIILPISMGAGLLDDDRGSVARRNGSINVAAFALFLIVLCSPLLLPMVYDFSPLEFWVKLPAAEGLDRSADAVTAPTFHITLRVMYDLGSNHGFWPLCGKGGRVDVAYAGVPIAHGDLPEFCVTAGTVGSVPVVATSQGLGLPDELYERMEGQRRRRERVKLEVRVRIGGLTGSISGSPLVLWCTAILHGQPKWPFICPMVK